MATEQLGKCISLPAAADFSAKQYYIVCVDSNGAGTLCTAATTQPVGILQNTPEAGEACSIAISGVSKCITGSALSIGGQVVADSTGKGTTATLSAVKGTASTQNYLVGRVVTASAAASGLAEVVIYPGGLPVLV